jgi:hypothetical protein
MQSATQITPSEYKDKMRKTKREIVLQPIDGKSIKNSVGLTDNRLFKRTNKLYGVQQPTGIWALNYEIGEVPPALKAQFTNFESLLRYVKEYYSKRNVEVTEVID